MKYSVIAEAYADSFGAASVGKASDGTDGDGYPVIAEDSDSVELAGVYSNSGVSTKAGLLFKANTFFNVSDPLPVTSVKIIDPVIGTTTIVPGDVATIQAVGGNILYLVSGATQTITTGQRVEIEVDFPDSLIIAPISGRPTLTAPYGNVSTPDDATGSIDLGTNWNGATSYSINGLPHGAIQSGNTGVVDYTFTGNAQRSLVTVVATNSAGSAQSSFYWNVYSSAGVNKKTRNKKIRDIGIKLGG